MRLTKLVILLFLLLSIAVIPIGGQNGSMQTHAQTSAPPPQTSTSAATPDPSAASPTSSTPTGAPTPAARPAHFLPVLISAVDQSGNPLQGLTKEQLTILDSNKLVQPLKVYGVAEIPLHLGIVLTASPKTFAQQQAAAIELVKKVIRPNVDEAFVVSSKGKKPWPGQRLDWANNPDTLTKQIREMDANAGLDDPFSFDLDTSSAGFGGRMTLQQYGSSGGISIFSAAFTMMSADPRPARRVLVMFREAWAHSPGFGDRVNTTIENALSRVIETSQKLHVGMFLIGLEDTRFGGNTDNLIGNNYTPMQAGGGDAGAGYDEEMERSKKIAYNAGRSNLERLATETGGAVFWSTKKNYPDAVNGISNLIQGQYIVTFIPADAIGPAHTLKVTASGAAKVLAPPAFSYGTAQ